MKKELKCIYCNNYYSCKSSLNRHIKFCFIRWEKMQKIKETNDKEISKLRLENKKLKINHKIEKLKILQNADKKLIIEKDLRIYEQAKTIEIAQNSKNITINNNSNKTINYLNTHFREMIAMEQFLKALEHTHQLTLQERKDLLNVYYDCGIEVFARNFSFIMKQNCKRQLESHGLEDMKLILLF